MKKQQEQQGKTQKRQVMIVDDEPDMLNMLQMLIKKNCDCDVLIARSAVIALEMLETIRPDVVVTDIKMPDMDGMELLRNIRSFDKDISVVIMTGYGTIDMAVQALKDGAYDFLQKPFEKDHIIRVIQNCLERASLLQTNKLLQKRIETLAQPEGIIGQGAAIKQRLNLLSRVAETDATVLIRGESGTGKELAARALHNMSNRKDKPLVTVNCPALPENILESELFGYAQGAFTGALKDKKGLFLEANGSTILLDEIGDISVSVQTKLLRVLQEKEIKPLGQNKTVKVDVRIVASTNQALEKKIESGKFREDLFYRLNIITVTMPNLEEMKDDVPLLIHHYLDYFKQKYNRELPLLSPEVLQWLYNRKWQGNIRELRNTIERLVLLSNGEKVAMSDIVSDTLECREAGSKDLFRETYDLMYNEAKQKVLKNFSVAYLNKLLSKNNGNVTRAGIECGLERQGLQRIMRRYGVASADFKAEQKKS